jgi:hypothetical protein
VARSYSFDAEAAQFLRACFELVDVRDGLATYTAAWAIMKVRILLLAVFSRIYMSPVVQSGNGSTAIRHAGRRGSTMAVHVQDLG